MRAKDIRDRIAGHPVLGISAGVLLLISGALASGRNTLLVPRETSDAHHVFEASCESCHVPFEGVTAARCLECHKTDLAKDTHPASIFDDPRWVGSLAVLDVRRCETCHREHRQTERGVTAAADLCFGCHDDVVQNRPTHRGFAADSCAASGCHNYHDNSRINESALRVRLTATPTPPLSRELPANKPNPPDASAPILASFPELVARWAKSGHAAASVGCADCHTTTGGDVIGEVDEAACARCHGFEAKTFDSGKHGVPRATGLAALSPAGARLAMRPFASGDLTCSGCHDSHSVDTREAAVEACLRCHADPHSLAYRTSPHARTLAVTNGAPDAREVTCATCHLSRVGTIEDGVHVVRVSHDNSASLRPADAMLDTCLGCHSMNESLAALLDERISGRNFTKWPSATVQTLQMLERKP